MLDFFIYLRDINIKKAEELAELEKNGELDEAGKEVLDNLRHLLK